MLGSGAGTGMLMIIKYILIILLGQDLLPTVCLGVAHGTSILLSVVQITGTTLGPIILAKVLVIDCYSSRSSPCEMC